MARKIYRNEKEKVIGGVCAGLADYFDIDVVIIRVIFIATALVWGSSIILYIVLWIAMPAQPRKELKESTTEEQSEPQHSFSVPNEAYELRKKKFREILAIILILIGISATLDNFLYWFSGKYWLPLVLIAIGIVLLLYPTSKVNEQKVEGIRNDNG